MKKSSLAITLLCITCLVACSNQLFSSPNRANTAQTSKQGKESHMTYHDELVALTAETSPSIYRVTDDQVTVEKVRFKNRETGQELVGIIYTPKDIDKTKANPAVVVAGPMHSIKEQTQSLYAKSMARMGYVTMVFDHLYFGESQGEPRLLENPNMKVVDIRSAIDYLESLDYVDKDRIAGVGVCGGGTYMVSTAAQDDRLRAITSVIPFTALDTWDLSDPDEMAEQRRLYEAGQADAAYVTSVPANALYYGEPDRGGFPEWSGLTVTWSEMYWDEYKPVEDAKKLINTPFLGITSDGSHTQPMTKELYEKSPGIKEYYEVKGASHMDMYDMVPFVPEALLQIEAFLDTYL